METTAPAPRAHPASQDAIRQQLHAMIETLSDELCTELHAVLCLLLEEDAASPPPAARVGQDSEPTGSRP